MKNSQRERLSLYLYSTLKKALIMISDAKDLAIGSEPNRVYYSVYIVDGVGIEVQNQFGILAFFYKIKVFS